MVPFVAGAITNSLGRQKLHPQCRTKHVFTHTDCNVLVFRITGFSFELNFVHRYHTSQSELHYSKKTVRWIIGMEKKSLND